MIDIEKKAKAYALKNAISYNGKAVVGKVISALFNEGLKKEDIGKYSKKIAEIVNEVNSLSLEEQKKLFEELKSEVSKRKVREGLPELPNVPKTGIITRFAPSASGPLHIGHTIPACLAFLYVKKYGGKFYVRIEDTNPENSYPDSYQLIKEDSEWLFEKTAEIVIQSDRMEIYYDYAEKLIEKNAAYVCSCTPDEFRECVSKKTECKCRNISVEENLERWKKMFNAFREGEAVLRFKTPERFGGMGHKNPAMRDFPLARINEKEHPRTGNKYRVWPLMNFAVAVDDIEMKMTHVIRGKDHRDNAERQKMIYAALGLEEKFPWTSFLGRIHFKDLELSTTKFREGINSGIYSGWDDPKLPTLASLRKRGYKPSAFWKLAERIGLSEADKLIEKKEYFLLLDSFNK